MQLGRLNNESKKFIKILFLTVFAVYFTGCSGKPVSFKALIQNFY